ncbi:MAG: hypothetical protein WD751_00050 [Anaerolineales bacterium]
MMMVDNQNKSQQELAYASTLQSKNNRCYFCQGTADGEGLKVVLHDPKTVQHGIAMRKWVTTTISVPRCKRCANVDKALKGYQTAFLVSALALMAIGTIAGIATYDMHQMDSLPIILAVVGFLCALAIFIARVRKLFRVKRASGSATMAYLNYAPVKYLQENGWKMGPG